MSVVSVKDISPDFVLWAKQNTRPSSSYMRQSAHFSLLPAAAWNLAEAAAQRMTKPRLQRSARAAGEQTPASNLCHATGSLTRTHGSGGFCREIIKRVVEQYSQTWKKQEDNYQKFR